MTRETPAQAELRPTCAAAPRRDLADTWNTKEQSPQRIDQQRRPVPLFVTLQSSAVVAGLYLSG
jgi:hypothetical protein